MIGIFRILWWRHQMETYSALLAICAGNSPVPGEFPTQGPVTRSFDVFFDPRLNKRLSKQPWGWWFDTPSWSSWRHCNYLQKSRFNRVWLLFCNSILYHIWLYDILTAEELTYWVLLYDPSYHIDQTGRSPKVVALFSATNFSSYIIKLLQLHDKIQIKWNYAWIHYNIAIWYKKMCDISFLVPNLEAFSCYTVNIHLEKWLMRCDTKRAIWWDLYNKYISIFCIKHMSTIFRTLQVNEW